jgi:Mg-chelatase subunit ChlD
VLPVADAGSLGHAQRRTWLLWAGLSAVFLALLLAFALQARAQSSEQPILKPGSDAVVVIDLSGSTRPASRAIARVLLRLTRDPSRHLGLVVFSDTAYEALPPSTPVDGLQGWLDLFAHDRPRSYPWTPSFSSGTAISSGLVLARRLLRRDGVTDPHVVLVSDLVDAAPDLEPLETVVTQYQREGIDLKVVAVHRKSTDAGPAAEFPNASFVERAASRTVDPSRSGPNNSGLIVAAVLLVALGLAAAVNELVLHPLTWRTQT